MGISLLTRLTPRVAPQNISTVLNVTRSIGDLVDYRVIQAHCKGALQQPLQYWSGVVGSNAHGALTQSSRCTISQHFLTHSTTGFLPSLVTIPG